jgi:phosphoenolpyruvate phosphomutase
MKRTGITNDARLKSLRFLLQKQRCLRIIEAHSPISALLAESARVDTGQSAVEYDGFWSSSLTDSTLKGKPDIETLDIKGRLTNINDIFEVTTKPMIVDGDTGGKAEHFELDVRSLELKGVSAVVIEDKTGLKKNSLLGTDVYQEQESISAFCDKIKRGKRAQISDEFMVIARIESLVLNMGMADAIQRAYAYVDAGADGILIHSRQKDPAEVFEFAKRFKAMHADIPLVCVPTSYPQTRFEELADSGFNIIIYANHMLRAAYPAMRDVAVEILRHGRTLEAEPKCLSINEILELIPGTK